LPFEPPLESPKVEVKDETGRIVFSFHEQGASIGAVIVSLRNEPYGRFELLLNEKHLLDLYIADISPIQCFGMLDIHFGELASGAGAFVEGKEFTSPVYSLNFQARATKWKYLISINNQDRFSAPEIREDRKKAKFTLNKEEVRLPDGSMAIEMLSDEPYALTRSPSRRLSLHLPKKGSSDSLDLDLPTPDASKLKAEKLSPKDSDYTFFSEMYVYI
jgi:hypothetical protein